MLNLFTSSKSLPVRRCLAFLSTVFICATIQAQEPSPNSPWWNQLISYDTFDRTEYAILQSSRLLPRRCGFDKTVCEYSDARAAKRLAKCACQVGFSALAACPRPATCAGPGSG